MPRLTLKKGQPGSRQLHQCHKISTRSPNYQIVLTAFLRPYHAIRCEHQRQTSKHPTPTARRPRLSDISRSLQSYTRQSSTFDRQRSCKRALGIKVLGIPAEALVLSPNLERRKESSFHPSDGEHQDGVPFDLRAHEICDNIREERGLVTEEIACLNLETIRRAIVTGQTIGYEDVGITIISDQKFQDLKEQLATGFTVAQLRAYMNRAATELPMHQSDLRWSYAAKTMSRSSWKYGTTEMKACTAPTLSTSAPRLFCAPIRTILKNKHSCIDSLLKRYWGMKSLSEAAENGEVDIRFSAGRFKSLLEHPEKILSKITDIYSAKIEASPSENGMRVTGPSASCGQAIQMIETSIELNPSGAIQLQPPHGR